jgi:osmotically-inducible protein OsmY
MVATLTTIARDDSEILEDVEHLIATYPPLTKDRHAIHTHVENGIVTISGHVLSPNTRRYFLDHAAQVAGVKEVHAEGFYDDSSIRLDVSRVLPTGVQAVVRYGGIVLAGEPPHDTSIEQLADKVLSVPGVVKVINGFGG